MLRAVKALTAPSAATGFSKSTKPYPKIQSVAIDQIEFCLEASPNSPPTFTFVSILI